MPWIPKIDDDWDYEDIRDMETWYSLHITPGIGEDASEEDFEHMAALTGLPQPGDDDGDEGFSFFREMGEMFEDFAAGILGVESEGEKDDDVSPMDEQTELLERIAESNEEMLELQNDDRVNTDLDVAAGEGPLLGL